MININLSPVIINRAIRAMKDRTAWSDVVLSVTETPLTFISRFNNPVYVTDDFAWKSMIKVVDNYLALTIISRVGDRKGLFERDDLTTQEMLNELGYNHIVAKMVEPKVIYSEDNLRTELSLIVNEFKSGLALADNIAASVHDIYVNILMQYASYMYIIMEGLEMIAQND